MELILNKKKKYVSSSCVFDLKKSVLKLFDRTVYMPMEHILNKKGMRF